MVGMGMPAYGIQSMLKEGHKHLSGLDEAVLKNIDACKQLSQITRTSLGPNGTLSLYPLSSLLFSLSSDFAASNLCAAVTHICNLYVSVVNYCSCF